MPITVPTASARRVSPLVGRILALGLGLAATSALPASAHTVMFRRVVHVRVIDQQIDVAMAVALHAGPEALRVRERFDADGNSDLDAAEQEAMLTWFETESFKDFGVRIDGVDVAFQAVERQLSLTDTHRVELGEGLAMRAMHSSALMLRPGLREIAVHDAPGNQREIIPVRVDLPVGFMLDGTEGLGGASKLVPADVRAWQALVGGEPGDLVLRVRVPKLGR